ncbi:hypothetical protein [Streptomyces paromomycinus]|uniref:Novel STAND NTPase 1 domain-containing protein n=1 Tax=Streptomyces paromomycinus TaxID=92743 RepID=A0A401VZ10_STREY|nr:hypothetical protein [Streptomyces paromomycinus]GCD42275.1 hypothetical protein GKJPGBOP_01934 [Streptomyces paromomycinus]
MVRNTADQAPYPGPTRYETGDQDRFFGRDVLIQQLMVMVRERPLPALAGPSGSGESPLRSAGPVAVAVPGDRQPLLKQHLGPSADAVCFINMTVVGRNPGPVCVQHWVQAAGSSRASVVT